MTCFMGTFTSPSYTVLQLLFMLDWSGSRRVPVQGGKGGGAAAVSYSSLLLLNSSQLSVNGLAGDTHDHRHGA